MEALLNSLAKVESEIRLALEALNRGQGEKAKALLVEADFTIREGDRGPPPPLGVDRSGRGRNRPFLPPRVS
jgi:hypothetical protein